MQLGYNYVQCCVQKSLPFCASVHNSQCLGYLFIRGSLLSVDEMAALSVIYNLSPCGIASDLLEQFKDTLNAGAPEVLVDNTINH